VALLDRMTVEQLRWAQVRRGLLTAIAAVLFGVGWLLARLVRAVKVGLTVVFFSLGYAASWSVAAMKVGYEAGRRGPA
jgi:hypothetical protein